MDERIEYNNYPFSRPHRRVREEKGRTPYDGLRPWSAITHGLGAVLGVLGTVMLLLRTVSLGKGPLYLAAFLLYGASMVGLYAASTLYHCLNTGVKGRIALRKYDHISIYFLIAGSYTPICLIVLPQEGGLVMLAAVWGVALAGTVMALLWINAPRWITSGIYIFMGWMAVFMLPALVRTMPPGRDVLAHSGRRTLHGGRRALCGQVARTEQSPFWLPRNLPRFYPSGQYRPFLFDVSRGRIPVTSPTKMGAPESKALRGAIF